jgi:NADH:ubiquinone oxidoreductase subunit 5 (subunit L)/multisubunit Na+/H+ antiporter MnhA subunit
MGGMRTRTPVAFWAMGAAVCAISGVPLFAGYFSKDQVIFGDLEHGDLWMWAVGLITAGITAYYMLRLFIVTFFGTYRGDLKPADVGIESEVAPSGSAIAHDTHEPHAPSTGSGQAPDHGHAPPWLMALPVAILGVFSVIAGYIMIGPTSLWAHFFARSFPHETLPRMTVTEGETTALAVLMLIVGAAVAYWRYGTREALANAPARLKRESETLPAILVRLYYWDDLIEWLFIKPSRALGDFFGRWFDPHFVDGVVREIVLTNRFLGSLVRSFQTGLLRAYALIIVFGAACFAVYYAVQGAMR